MIQGIYRIYGSTGKSYIGRSNDIRRRLNAHRSEMRRGVHKNKYLQSSYDKYGTDFFMFEILEVVEDNETIEIREQFYIDKFDSFKNGYNLSMAISNKTTWAVSKGSRPQTSAKVKLWWSEGSRKEDQSIRVKARFTENPDTIIRLLERSNSPEQVEIFKKRMSDWRSTLSKEESSALAKKSSDSKTPEILALAEIRQRVAKARRWLDNKLPKHNHFGFKNIGFTTHVYKGVVSTYVLCHFSDTLGKKIMKKFPTHTLGLLPAMAEAIKWRDEIMTPMYEKFIEEYKDI